MRAYNVSCPDCMKTIVVKMEAGDKRRNADKFFIIVCEHCGHQWFAKIFETLVTYPHKLSLKETK